MAGYDLYLAAQMNVDQVALRPVNKGALVYIADEYLQMLDTLTTRLKPTCSSAIGDFDYEYSCTAFDGTVETWRMHRAGLFSPWMVQRGAGAPWEEGTITSADQEDIAALAMRNTIRPDAVEAMNNLYELKARLLAP